MDLIQKDADDGDAESQSIVGLGYFSGVGGEINTAKAIHYFELAAAQGHAAAAFRLGVCYQVRHTLFRFSDRLCL
jgi:TPR repeat protein